MTYSRAFKSGFHLINRKWQLVAVQAGMMVFNCLAFFIMVGIPLGVAFIIFGLDLTGLSELKDILGLLRNPAELFSKYFGLIMVVITSFLLYLVLITTVGLYVFSGSIGIIGRSITDPDFKFSMRNFFGEAKKHFFPIMWYSLLVGLLFILIAFILGLFAGGIGAVVTAAKSQDSTLALFLGIFFSLVLALVGIGIILGALAAAVYGIAVLFFKNEGAVSSFRDSLKFLWNYQQAFWLYVVLFLGYILASFVVMLVVYPFNLIPIIGPIISFPFQILSYVAQGYLGLVIIAVVFNYYHDREIRAAEVPEKTETAVPTGEASTGAEDTSASQAHGQETIPPEKEETKPD